MAYYGILAMFAALACCLLVIFYMFNIVAHMRNELGFIIGTASLPIILLGYTDI